MRTDDECYTGSGPASEVTDSASKQEVLIAIERVADYEDVHQQMLVEDFIQFVGRGGEGWPWRIVEPSQAAPQADKAGDVVVTWNESRTRIMAVTRQDEDGRVLKVIAEAPPVPQADDKTLRDAERYRWLRDGGIWRLPYDDHGAGPEFDLSEAAIDAAMTKKLEQA